MMMENLRLEREQSKEQMAEMTKAISKIPPPVGKEITPSFLDCAFHSLLWKTLINASLLLVVKVERDGGCSIM